MDLIEAEEILNTVKGRSLRFIQAWGIREVQDAVWTVRHRGDSSVSQKKLGEEVGTITREGAINEARTSEE